MVVAWELQQMNETRRYLLSIVLTPYTRMARCMKFQQSGTVRILLLSLFALTCSSTALATALTSKANVDNGYEFYISLSNDVTGDLFGAHNDWYTSYVDTTTLAAGTDYFLHVHAYDQGGIAGFLGEFSLSGSDHVFANGTTQLVTNTTDWSGNNTGFSGTYGNLISLGLDGVQPWGNRPDILDTAQWIWAGDAHGNDHAYFTTRILATQHPVNEPISIALIGIGVAGLAFTRRKKPRRQD